MTEKQPPLQVDEALKTILAGAKGLLGVEPTPLARAFGRTLAEDIFARRTQPPKALSAMDGYALRAADTGARKVIGESVAGRGFAGACGAGEAVRIFTGAPVPQGADTVLIQEEASRDGDFVTPTAPIASGRNVRHEGIDFREGERILQRGRRLTSADIALAASADHATLPLARAPRVGVLATGDELVAPGEKNRGPDQIVASNSFSVLGLILAAGGDAVDLGMTSDRLDEIEAAITEARAKKVDVLVTIGGASVGDRDLVRGALAREGMELNFWRVNMKPGKPLIYGHIGEMTVLGLPGNPVSAVVCGELFLKPLIRGLLGDLSAGADRTEPAIAGARLRAGGPRQEFLRATLAFDAEGRQVATPATDQDSSLNRVLSQSQALISREAGAPACEAGAPLRILRLTL